jgi:hypothetical protein
LCSGDVVVLDGDGLKGSGEGFFVEESAGRFALEQGGELRIELGERGHVVLSTPDRGPIVVQRSPESGEYELRASQNARLAFWPLGADAEQQPQAVLQAAELVLRGRQGGQGVFVPSGVTAVDEVQLEHGLDHFEAERARLAFDADGSAREAILEGSPRGTAVLLSADGSRTEVLSSGSEPPWSTAGCWRPCSIRATSTPSSAT